MPLPNTGHRAAIQTNSEKRCSLQKLHRFFQPLRAALHDARFHVRQLPAILDPRDTYADAGEWDTKAKDLASRFVKNFSKYAANEAGKALVAAGPKAE